MYTLVFMFSCIRTPLGRVCLRADKWCHMSITCTLMYIHLLESWCVCMYTDICFTCTITVQNGFFKYPLSFWPWPITSFPSIANCERDYSYSWTLPMYQRKILWCWDDGIGGYLKIQLLWFSLKLQHSWLRNLLYRTQILRSRSSVSRCKISIEDFDLIWICIDKFEFLDLVDLGG